MMGSLNDKSHILQRHDNIPSGILAAVQRSYIKISRLFIGLGRRHGVFVCVKKEKFTLRPHIKGITQICRLFDGFL